MPATSALLSRLSAVLVTADNLKESCIATKPKTLPLESTITIMI